MPAVVKATSPKLPAAGAGNVRFSYPITEKPTIAGLVAVGRQNLPMESVVHPVIYAESADMATTLTNSRGAPEVLSTTRPVSSAETCSAVNMESRSAVRNAF